MSEETVQLSAEQLDAIQCVKSGRNVLITGSAGTGKSTILKALNREYPHELPVCASTGIAAVNVGGLTLHSWTGIGLAQETAKVLAKRIIKNERAPYWRIKNAKRLAIDEISMISAQLFTKLDEIFRTVRDRAEPFGGVQLIMFGDFLQLPPVIKSFNDVEQGKFCFECKSWHDARVKVFLLRKVYRQSEQAFVDALNEIRVGRLTEGGRAILNARFKARDTDPLIEPVVIHTHNMNVDQLNLARLAKITTEERKFEAQDSGRPGPLAMLQQNCLAPATLRLKVDAQVMLLTNLDPASGLANGSIGKVVELKAKSGNPRVKFQCGITTEIERHDFEVKSEGMVLACRRQLPLRLAWAITAHKSQGMTLDKIEVHLAGVFEDGQAYVALSRARSVAGLFIRSGGRNSIRANQTAVDFYERATA